MTLDLDPSTTVLDLRGTPCPINFVRIKLKLAQMSPGETLEVWLDLGEPIEQVPDSLRMEGYIIEAIANPPDANPPDVNPPNYGVLKVVCPQ